MEPAKKKHEKNTLHSRNKNRERYDLNALRISNPELSNYIKPNKFGDDSIDFANPVAVKLLNKALLNYYYGINYWEFPNENLCPPIPGRADYIHYVADLITESNSGTIPSGNRITCFDVGIGASSIFPILGVIEYDWNFIGSDISPESIASSQNIIDSNESLKHKIECRLQKNPSFFFREVLNKNERIDLSICNPPFHSSLEEAQEGSRRKIRNLSGRNEKSPSRNFSGIYDELIFKGGEYAFISTMISESEEFASNCFWFSTLVSKQSNLERLLKKLERSSAKQIQTIPMGTGNKSTRILAWSFLSKGERNEWRKNNWD